MRRLSPLIAIIGAGLLSGCGAGDEQQAGVRDGPGPAFSAIGEGEVINLRGNEPFWNAQVEAGKLRYKTPEDPDGTLIEVTRFNGNNGMGLSGELDGAPFRVAITSGECTDGMSDARYPYTVTLRIGEETRLGCAWTDSVQRTGGES